MTKFTKIQKIEILKNEFSKLDVKTSKTLYKLCMDLEFSHLVYNAVKKELNLGTAVVEEKCPVKTFFEVYNMAKANKSAGVLVGLKLSVEKLEEAINNGLEFKYTGALEIAKKIVAENSVKIEERIEFVKSVEDSFYNRQISQARMFELLAN